MRGKRAGEERTGGENEWRDEGMRRMVKRENG